MEEITELRRLELEESARILTKMSAEDLPPDLPEYESEPVFPVVPQKIRYKIATQNKNLEIPDDEVS